MEGQRVGRVPGAGGFDPARALMKVTVDTINGKRYAALTVGRVYAVVWIEWPVGFHVGHTKRPRVRP